MPNGGQQIILKWEDIQSILPLSNVGIVGLLWMNQRQHCVGSGEGQVNSKTQDMLAKV